VEKLLGVPVPAVANGLAAREPPGALRDGRGGATIKQLKAELEAEARRQDGEAPDLQSATHS
jgi:hypothetical protein